MTVAAPDTARPAPAEGSRLRWALNDARVLTGRYVHHILRQPDEIITSIMVPTVMLLLFRYMLGDAIDIESASYVNFLIPGVLTVGVTLIAVSTTTGVHLDMQEGFVDRFRSMSVAGSAVVVGHVVAGVLRAAIALTVLLGVGFLVGFRPTAGPVRWIGAVLVLALFAFAVAWLAALLGQVASSPAGASGLALIITFLPYASNLFAPAETMAPGLRHFVEHQPVTAVIDALRALLLDQPLGNSLWLVLAWWGGLTVIAVLLSGRLFRRRFS